MIAIMTKYIGPTNYRGSRIKAYTCNGHTLTISYDYGLSDEERHKQAAEQLRDKQNWKGELIGGGTKDGYAFVFKP